MENKIKGGATIWARQTLESDIFLKKPDKWFKIWFYIVNRVNHKDHDGFKRGSGFIKYSWITDNTGANKNQIKHCISYLKQNSMITTQKGTRGMTVFVLGYDKYQSLENYKGTQKGTEKEHKRDTINKNDKNDKNEYSTQKKVQTYSTERENKFKLVYDTYIGQFKNRFGFEPEINYKRSDEAIRYMLERHSLKGLAEIIKKTFELEQGLQPERANIPFILSDVGVSKYLAKIKLNPLMYANADEWNKEVY